MCWSLSASAAMMVVGAGAAVHAARRSLPRAVPLTLGFFAVMEGLQAAGYLVVDQCGAPANRVLTQLSYLHIALQPLFINALALSFVPAEVSRRIGPAVYALCAASSAFMLFQLYPAEWAGTCRIGQPLCGRDFCLRWGLWHIGWDVPYNGLTRPIDDLARQNWGFPTYVFTAFALPVLYGSWRFSLFHALSGPILAGLLTRDPNEAPAIWCLFSIAIAIAVVFPLLLRQGHVRTWPLWPRGWTMQVGQPRAGPSRS